jgi:sigma-B regulation protein RsbQ
MPVGCRLMSVQIRNHVKIGGQAHGQPIMFAHGFGCDQNMWRFVAPAFEADYRTILFDHVGAGRSDLSAYDSEKYSSLDGYAEDVLEICEELDLHDVIFVGHSVSSIIGVLACNREPERFDKLVLVGPSPAYINDGDYIGGFTREDIDELLESVDSNYLGWSATMAPVIMGNTDRPQLGEELVNSFCQTDPDIARHFAHVTFTSDNRADLVDVKVPALILQCSHDAIAPQVVGEYVHRVIPNSEFVLMKASGHCPNLSAPGETVAAIKGFL